MSNVATSSLWRVALLPRERVLHSRYMSINRNGNAPYASPKNVLDVIERYRHRGLRTPFTLDLLGQVGVPDGAAPRTLQALRLLDLIDEDGQPTEALEDLKRASEDEYPVRLGQIVRAAYNDVFSVVDPASDSATAVRDAFRFYKPDSQQTRMVTLFLALSEEAGIIEKGPRRRGRMKKAASVKPSVPRPQSPPRETLDQRPQPRPIAPTRDGLHPLLVGVVQELPSTGKWSTAKRGRWLAAMTSAVDLLYAVEDSKLAGGVTDDE
jgi:Family of unknown function (DUF5343)